MVAERKIERWKIERAGCLGQGVAAYRRAKQLLCLAVKEVEELGEAGFATAYRAG